MKSLALLWLSVVCCYSQLIIDPYRFATSSTLNTGLTAYWKMDEASGTRVDSGPNGQDLTDNNTVTSNTGIISNAGQFVAANTEYLSRADSATLSTGNIDYTFAVWVYMDTKTSSRIFIAKEAAGQREYRIWYNQPADRFQYKISSDGTAVTDVVANNFGSPSTATWYFIVAFHDAGGDQIGISVNNGTPNTSAYSGGSIDGTAAFWVGRDAVSGFLMDGRIDELPFWKRVLTPTEITELYNAGAGKTCCPFAP